MPKDFIIFQQTMCCAYGTKGTKTTIGYDCVQIPGASKATSPVNQIVPNTICGRSAGLVTAKGKVNKTICSKKCFL